MDTERAPSDLPVLILATEHAKLVDEPCSIATSVPPIGSHGLDYIRVMVNTVGALAGMSSTLV
jgi:hypothetical protein